MRPIRVRFTVRTMMVLVAVLGLASLGGRELWTRWLRRAYRNPVSPSQLRVHAGQGNKIIWSADRPASVFITYNFRFGTPTPPPGASCVLLAEVWFEDMATGRAVEMHTFDARLTGGGREVATESFIWDAVLPGPGRYFLRSQLGWYTPGGELRMMSGNGLLVQVVAADPTLQPETASGAFP